MPPSKIRRALGAVKDQTSISLAKVTNTTSLSDLDVAILKCTRHEEYPAEEKHVREIISLTSYSRTYVSACVAMLSRRLAKTRNWTVALKTLLLIHRLVSEGDAAYHQEIFFATRRGTRLLNMSDFRDTTGSDSWDFSAYVRTYALYLDERLEFRMQGRRGRDEDDDEAGTTSSVVSGKMTPLNDVRNEVVFSRMQHLQQLLERFLACRPTGRAKGNRVVLVSLYPIVKESFRIYYDTTEVMGILIDRFMELGVSDCVKTYDIFCRSGKQFEELETFYIWCRDTGIARSSEYPEVEKITQKKLDVMDEFIRDKSALAHKKENTFKPEPNIKEPEPKEREQEQEQEQKQEEREEQEEEDLNGMKALPPPEPKLEPLIENNQKEGDFLDLREDHTHTHTLELALFNNDATSSTSSKALPASLAWDAFANQESSDWEKALVESATHLSGEQTALGGGFDMMLLDGMYQKQGGARAASGSASSVVLGSPMLALPAPNKTLEGSNSGLEDPFAASAMVAPPAYVQMTDMEKKQRLLAEEQRMWTQYASDGMQGQLGFSNMRQANHYGMGR